jgi:hypothetical protein
MEETRIDVPGFLRPALLDHVCRSAVRPPAEKAVAATSSPITSGSHTFRAEAIWFRQPIYDILVDGLEEVDDPGLQGPDSS